MPPAPNLLPSAEVCARLSIHPSTLSRWVRNGKITPAFKIGGLRGPFLFRASDVERIAQRRGERSAS